MHVCLSEGWTYPAIIIYMRCLFDQVLLSAVGVGLTANLEARPEAASYSMSIQRPVCSIPHNLSPRAGHLHLGFSQTPSDHSWPWHLRPIVLILLLACALLPLAESQAPSPSLIVCAAGLPSGLMFVMTVTFAIWCLLFIAANAVTAILGKQHSHLLPSLAQACLVERMHCWSHRLRGPFVMKRPQWMRDEVL